uniref:Peptidase inhibitor 3 n=1 Tax=Felis catus TaxID=9685 RepID=A0ABI7Y5V3_FELCA
VALKTQAPCRFLLHCPHVALIFVAGQGTDKGRVLVKGQDPVRGQDPVKTKDLLKVPVSTKPGSCPNILMRCAMMNPPNHCLRDTECPGAKKCCHGPCGLACLDPQ